MVRIKCEVITLETVKSGILGKDISYSLSPFLFKVLSDSIGMQVEYERFDMDLRTRGELEDFLMELSENGYAGINVTIPYKTLAAEACNYLLDRAMNIEAVNTIVFDEGTITGSNTDYLAIKEVITAMNIHEACNVLLIGAGGAARAYAYALSEVPFVNLFISNRTKTRAVLLQQRLKRDGRHVEVIGLRQMEEMEFHGIVHATPVGRENEELPVSRGVIEKSDFVIDAVYKPGNTELINTAREINVRAVDGSRLLFLQGVESFEAISKKQLTNAEALYTRFIDEFTNGASIR